MARTIHHSTRNRLTANYLTHRAPVTSSLGPVWTEGAFAAGETWGECKDWRREYQRIASRLGPTPRLS